MSMTKAEVKRAGFTPGNTKIDVTDDLLKVVLHRTLVLEEMPNGNVWLNNGGWPTATTRGRMNEGLHYLRRPLSVFQHKHAQYVRNRTTGEQWKFDRAIVLNANNVAILIDGVKPKKETK